MDVKKPTQLVAWWCKPRLVPRTSAVCYVALYDDGRSPNIVITAGNQQVQLPKWLMRDLLSLSYVAYPRQRLVRRNTHAVTVFPAMTDMLTANELKYDPGNVRTDLTEVPLDPEGTFDHVPRANLARGGDHNAMYRMILDDIAEAEAAGANVAKRSGVAKVVKDYGWNAFEVVMVAHVRSRRGGIDG
jgi:hypothetical protein